MDKIQRSNEISDLIASFCKKHLTDQYLVFAMELVEMLSRKRKLDITRGKKEIWAAAIVYAIARLNFLFDTDSWDHITLDVMCDFFGTTKSTISTKGSSIIKSCKIKLGDPRFCRLDIVDPFTYIKTPDGFIVPLSTAVENGLIYELMDADEARELEARFDEMRRINEEKKAAEEAHKEALRLGKEAEKSEKKHKNQIDMFGGKLGFKVYKSGMCLNEKFDNYRQLSSFLPELPGANRSVSETGWRSVRRLRSGF